MVIQAEDESDNVANIFFGNKRDEKTRVIVVQRTS